MKHVYFSFLSEDRNIEQQFFSWDSSLWEAQRSVELFALQKMVLWVMRIIMSIADLIIYSCI